MNNPAMAGTPRPGPDERWEAQVRAGARSFPYPPTPNIAAAVRRELRASRPARRPLALSGPWARALAILLAVLAAASLAVPQVRAAILEFLQIGAVRIFLVPPSPTPTPTPAPTTTGTPVPTATPIPTPTLLPSLLDLAGATSLADAQARAPFPVLVPAYPEGLGLPDRVFYQDGPLGQTTVLVWLDPGRPGQVLMSLHTLTCEACVGKSQPEVVQFTEVNGQAALWTDGPYLVEVTSGAEVQLRRLVAGHVLIWTEDSLTYRLETDLPLEEAVRVAESLRPAPAAEP